MTVPVRVPGASLDLLALCGSLSLASVQWLGVNLRYAPDLRARITVCHLIGEVAARQDRVAGRLGDAGLDEVDALSAFDGLFDDFDARTPTSTWWEGLVKDYIADGLVRDFGRLAASGVAGDCGTFITQILTGSPRAAQVADDVAVAAAADAVLASRLALWGRRLVGEVLTLVQGLLERPGLAAAIALGGDQDHPRGRAWVFSQLTAEHARRMERLGLAA